MPAALSLNLRHRVIKAIEAGASCRQAAARFGIGVATAIRWQANVRHEGRVAAKPQGGDRSSHRVEAHAALIMRLCEERPSDLSARVARSVARARAAHRTSGLSRFFARHEFTRKKGRFTRPSRSATT